MVLRGLRGKHKSLSTLITAYKIYRLTRVSSNSKQEINSNLYLSSKGNKTSPLINKGRIVYIVSLGIIMKYNSGNSASLKTNRNIFQIFNEYIFRLLQGTLTQLHFYLQNITKLRIKYTDLQFLLVSVSVHKNVHI